LPQGFVEVVKLLGAPRRRWQLSDSALESNERRHAVAKMNEKIGGGKGREERI